MRPLGFFSACALGTGTMIGAGIFALAGEVAGATGPAAVVTYALAGLAALAQAVSFAELASSRPGSGGPYLYVRDFLGDALAAVAGWQLWTGTALSVSFYALGFARYLAYFAPGVPEWLGACACAGLLAALNAAGRGGGAALQAGSALFLIAVLGGLSALGAARVDPAFWSPFAPRGWQPVVGAVPLVFISYLGFDAVAQAASAFARPQWTVPRAMLVSVGLVTALYCAVVAVSTGVMHYLDLAQTPTPLAQVADRLVGRPGALVVAAAGLVATLSSANGALIAAAELTAVMAADGLLPARLAPSGQGRPPDTRPAEGSRPAPLAHLVTALVACVGLALATASGGLAWLARGTGLLHLVPFLLVPAAQVAARRRADHRPAFRAPGGWLSPALAGLAMLGVLRQVTWHEVSAAVLLSLPGLAWYLRTRGGLPGPPRGPGASRPGGPAGRSTARRPRPPGAAA